jgi:hypothetical protein
MFGKSTPVVAMIFFNFSSTLERFASGLGQSVPFIETGFQIPLVTSAEK